MIRKSLVAKFSVICLLILSVTLTIMVLIYEYIYTVEYEASVLDASSRTLYSMNSALNSLIKEVSTFSTSVLAESTVHELINENNMQYDVTNEIRLETLLYQLSTSTEKITSINIFDLNNHQYSTYPNNLYMPSEEPSDFRGEDWYAEVANMKGGVTVVTWISEEQGFDGYPGIKIIRQLIDPDTLKQNGLVSFGIGNDVLNSTFSAFTENYDATLFLLDPDGEKLAEFNPREGIDTDGIDLSFFDSGSRFIDIGDTRYALDVIKNNSTDLTMVSLSPISGFGDSTEDIRFMTLIILIGGVSIALLGILIVTRRLLRPIHALSDSMSRVIEKGEFVPVTIKTGTDEIGVLKDIYNKMIETTQIYLSNSILQEKQKRKSEMKALQAQIKPHFLYNTFDAISYLALQGDNETVYHAISQLSAYYRLSLSNGKEYIPLSDDVKLIKQYEEILKIRYPDAFVVTYETDDEADRYLLPKLTLQPFVENAIHHGIFPLGETGIITLKSRLSKETVVIEIVDNGVGMPKEKIDYLLDPEPSKSNSSFGARSTIERIRLLYGSDCNINIESIPNKGTTVTIEIPAKEIMI